MDTLKKVVFLGFGILVSAQGFVAAMESSQAGSSSAQEVVVAADDDDSELPRKRALEEDGDELAATFRADQPRAKAQRIAGDGGDVHSVVDVEEMKTSAGILVRMGRALKWPFARMKAFVADHWPQSEKSSDIQKEMLAVLKEQQEDSREKKLSEQKVKQAEEERLREQATQRAVVLSRLKSGDKNLVGVDLKGINLSGFDFSDVDLTDADLSGAILVKAKFNKNSKLVRTKFIGAKLIQTDLSDAVCRAVDFSYAEFSFAIFSKTRMIDGTKLRNAKFDNIVFDEVIFDFVDFSSDEAQGRYKTSFKSAWFVKSQLSNVNMNGIEVIERLVFNGTKLDNINFSCSQLHGLCLMNNNYLGRRLNFTGATLIECAFIGKETGMFFGDERIPELRCCEVCMPLKAFYFCTYPIMRSFVESLAFFERECCGNHSVNVDVLRMNSCIFDCVFLRTSFFMFYARGIAFLNCQTISSICDAKKSVFKNVGYARSIDSDDSDQRDFDSLRHAGAKVNEVCAPEFSDFWKTTDDPELSKMLAQISVSAVSGAAATAGSKVAEWAIKKYAAAEAAKLPAAAAVLGALG